MLIISLDSVGDKEFDVLAQYPAVSSFLKKAAVFRDVNSVFLSNTYPVHTSVATGVLPCFHGIKSNTQAFPARYPFWNSRESGIKTTTLWQAAAKQGIKSAAVFWPVTAYSKTISYNVPEVLARPGKSQLLTSLKAGSFWLQLKLFLRYRKLLNGVNQPQLDNFAAACMADILRKYKPPLALVHLTAYDTLCHKNGKDSEVLKKAYESFNNNLKILLDAAGDMDVIIFSDHSQINVHTVIEPNKILAELGFLAHNGGEYTAGESKCFIECCGGSAFFHTGKLASRQIEKVRTIVSGSEWFYRFLTENELKEAGYEDKAFGFCAKAGYCFAGYASVYKANHGYPLDMPDYKVFYIVKNKDFTPGHVKYGGSLLDIAPIAAKILGVGKLDLSINKE